MSKTRALFKWQDAFRTSKAPSNVANVMWALAGYADTDKLTCYPTLVQLAENLGLTDRAVRGNITEAVKHGWVVREATGHRGRATTYRLTVGSDWPPKPKRRKRSTPKAEAHRLKGGNEETVKAETDYLPTPQGTPHKTPQETPVSESSPESASVQHRFPSVPDVAPTPHDFEIDDSETWTDRVPKVDGEPTERPEGVTDTGVSVPPTLEDLCNPTDFDDDVSISSAVGGKSGLKEGAKDEAGHEDQSVSAGSGENLAQANWPISFDSYALMPCCTVTVMDEAERRGLEPYKFLTSAGEAFKAVGSRTIDAWGDALRELPVEDQEMHEVSDEQLGLPMDAQAMPPADANDSEAMTLSEFCSEYRMRLLGDYLNLRDQIVGDGRDLWGYQRAVLSELLYGDDVMTERGWYLLFMHRDWAVDERDLPEGREGVRAHHLDRVRRAQVALGVTPKHGAALRVLQHRQAELLGDALLDA